MDPHHDTSTRPGWGRTGLHPLLGMAQQVQGLMGQPAQRARRGDVRAAILRLLTEEPMHGYQIIREIEDRSGGTWKPSAGSVYPTLQLLADEGLVAAEEQNGRKTYSLTEAGRATADEADAPAPWEGNGNRESGRHVVLAKAGMDLAGAAAQVARTGSSAQADQAVEVLEDARRKLYAILAEG